MLSSPETAELAKLLENIFRSVNIALVNEVAQLCDRLGIDVWEVVDAAATKPFGFMRFDPGPGMGGHCLPVDPFYLAFKAREHDFYPEFVELAGKVNQAQPEFCVRRIERSLNGAGKPVKGSKILILGAAYKPGIGDTRESPALRIIALLRDLGAEISYHDPFVPELPAQELESVDLDAGLAAADLLAIVTAHPGVDHEAAVKAVPLAIDFRGISRKFDDPRRRAPLALHFPTRAVKRALAALQRRHGEPGGVEHLPVVLGGLARAGPDDRLAAVVDLLGDPVALVEADPGQHPREGLGDVVEGVVVVVADDHPPVSAEARIGSRGARFLDRRGGHARDYALMRRGRSSS